MGFLLFSVFFFCSWGELEACPGCLAVPTLASAPLRTGPPLMSAVVVVAWSGEEEVALEIEDEAAG